MHHCTHHLHTKNIMIAIFINQLNAFKRTSLRNETDKLLFLSVCFSTGLLIMRMIATKSIYYVFLEWNLFLAFVPYLLSSLLLKQKLLRANNYFFALVTFIWILFIPNAFYILT